MEERAGLSTFYILVKEGLLNSPILYLSRFINQNKAGYYKLLQKVRNENAWEEWILYILTCIEETSFQTIRIIQSITDLIVKHDLKYQDQFAQYYIVRQFWTIFSGILIPRLNS